MADWAKLRGQLWERSGGHCEITGQTLDPETFDAHHRRPKGMGGTSKPDKDWLTNLLALTPAIHNGGPQSVHGRTTWSRPRGYLLPKDTPWAGMVPVLLLGRRWVMLGEEGGYFDAPYGLQLDSSKLR